MGRSRLLPCGSPWSRILVAALPLLLITVLTVAPARRAAAQAGNTHIVISEVVGDLEGTDAAREYIEFANLGTTEWNPVNHWIFRWAIDSQQGSPQAQTMLRISGPGAAQLKAIPPGGVLLVEWGRPDTDRNFPANPGANVFATGRDAANGADTIQINDLQSKMAIALFAPQNDPPPFPDVDPDFGGARMLAYYYQGHIVQADGEQAAQGARLGMTRAAALGLWEAGKAVPANYDSTQALRWPAMAPGQPVPAVIGRRVSDYYQTDYGLPDLSNATRSVSTAGSTTLARRGTPGRPNFQFEGAELIPGQTLSNGNSLMLYQAAATTATTAIGSPAAAIQVAATSLSGAIAENMLTSNAWLGWQFVGGPSVSKPVFLDNPKSGTRLLLVTDALSGQLYAARFAADGSFQGWKALGKISGTPVAVVDAATGNEVILFNDTSGQTKVITGTGGLFNASVGLPGNAKLVGLAAAITPSGVVIFGFDGNQLRRTILGTDGKLSDLANVGAAIANRALIEPVVRFNPVANQVEVLVAGAAGALQLIHVKPGATDTVSAPVSVGISTDSTPGLAVNTQNGDVVVLARVANLPPPSGEKFSAQAGQARTAALRNGAATFLASARIAAGLIPAGASPDIIYNANTQRFEEFLIGEDYQLYRNVAQI